MIDPAALRQALEAAGFEAVALRSSYRGHVMRFEASSPAIEPERPGRLRPASSGSGETDEAGRL